MLASCAIGILITVEESIHLDRDIFVVDYLSLPVRFISVRLPPVRQL